MGKMPMPPWHGHLARGAAKPHCDRTIPIEMAKTNTHKKKKHPLNASGVQAHGVSLLLDRPLPPGYLRELTERVAAPNLATDAGTRSVVIFRMGTERLALPTTVFREVVEDCPFHSIPHRAGHAADGLVIVRGEILICVALDMLLG